jgi:nucleotide-binding universal stress UspA family protein
MAGMLDARAVVDRLARRVGGPRVLALPLLRTLALLVAVAWVALAPADQRSPALVLAVAGFLLAAAASELRAKGLRLTTTVRRGEPVDEILAAAREADADLIAMTTHGRSGLSRLLFGSIAAAVLARAEIPVFLLRQTAAQVRARAAWEAIT